MRDSSSRRRLAALAVGVLGATLGVQGVGAQSASGILLDEMATVFAFGDSYTYDGYDPAISLTDFKGIGNTSTGGYNWVQYLTAPSSIYDPSESSFSPNHTLTLYDLAFSGATTNNTIVTGSAGIPDFVAQVTRFQQYFAAGQGNGTAVGRWSSSTTLFALWFGINDIGFSYLQNKDLAAELDAIFATWNRMIGLLYAAGARNFLVLGVPPTQRTPLVRSYGDGAEAAFERNIGLYNTALTTFTSSLPSLYSGSRVALFDTQPFFNAILNSPEQYGFAEADTYCDAYAVIMDQPEGSLAECTWPLQEYVWWNAYHPTWPVHKLLALVLANTLSNPTSITTTSTLAPSPTSSANLSTTASASEVTTLTTVLPSSFIPTTSLSASGAGAETETVTASASVGRGGGDGSSGTGRTAQVGAAEAAWAAVAGAALAVLLVRR